MNVGSLPFMTLLSNNRFVQHGERCANKNDGYFSNREITFR